MPLNIINKGVYIRVGPFGGDFPFTQSTTYLKSPSSQIFERQSTINDDIGAEASVTSRFLVV